MRKSTATGNSVMICLALGSKDRSVSVWTTLGRRAFLVVRDLFANSVSDLTWSSDGKELLACSLDGSISYMAFTSEEIGEPLNVSEVTYGQSLLDSLSSDGLSTLGPLTCEGPQGVAKADASGVASAPVLLETPEALALQRSQAELRNVKFDLGYVEIVITDAQVEILPPNDVLCESPKREHDKKGAKAKVFLCLRYKQFR
ncbi:unnamed protein product [Dibothriocephalus latus]|uniref:Uncharacterized protein n=1 Tax=Dibothriocephalus latus TaxID=60516 RepID=A0A3P7LXP0_DIBLA|nr:unnamed protein product [Dibothriocephalus latus]